MSALSEPPPSDPGAGAGAMIYLSQIDADKPHIGHIVDHLLGAGYRLFIDYPERIDERFTRDFCHAHGIETRASADGAAMAVGCAAMLGIFSNATLGETGKKLGSEPRHDERMAQFAEIALGNTDNKNLYVRLGPLDLKALPALYHKVDFIDLSPDLDRGMLAKNFGTLTGRLAELIASARAPASRDAPATIDPPSTTNVPEEAAATAAPPAIESRLDTLATRLEALSVRLRAEAGQSWAAARALMPRLRPRTLLIAVGLVGLPLLALHVAATIAVRDRIAAASPARPGAMVPDLVFEGRTPMLALARDPALEVRRDNQLAARFGSAAALSGEAQMISPSQVLLRAPDGTLELVRLGRRTAPITMLDGVGGVWRRALWTPIASFANGTLLPLVAQVDPLSIPAQDRPRRAGSPAFLPGSPRMVSIGAGWTFSGPMWWQRQSPSERRTLVRVEGFALSRRPVTPADWIICSVAVTPCINPKPAQVSANAVLATPSEAAGFITMLGLSSGRQYRLATGTEWDVAIGSLKVDPTAERYAGELICLDPINIAAVACARPAIRDRAKGTDLVIAPNSKTRAAFRVVDTGLALDRSPGTQGSGSGSGSGSINNSSISSNSSAAERTKAFQRAHGLPADGVLGPKTQQAMSAMAR